jgi:membrane-bound metal-dependent hydrolase YbcI (DUF457 family)
MPKCVVMFIGHAAVGFAAKRAAPNLSLGVLMMAPMLLDLLWPFALLLGVEHVRIDPGNTAVTPLDLYDYPYTHSLLTAVGWSVLFAVIVLATVRDRRSAVVAGAAVFSHWVLDWVTHRPDMPLYPGSDKYVGLGLWNSLIGTMVVELLMFAGGVALYLTTTRASHRRGSFALWALVVFLLVVYAGALFGPPPPSTRAIAIAALVAWVFVPWAYFIDRNRA